jgi:hypothetical protein
MHGAALREHDRRGADRKHGIYEDTVAKEDTGLEMDNFQDLQLGSITPLVCLGGNLPPPYPHLTAFLQDMDRIFVL